MIGLVPAYLCKEHVLSPVGRARAFKALSAPLSNPKASISWTRFLRSNTLARRLVRETPDFAVKPLLKYLNMNYEFADKVRTLLSHYNFVTQEFSEEDIRAIYFGDGIDLAEFRGKSGTVYRVRLTTYAICHCEGEMVLKIETSAGDVICFAIFSVGSFTDGRRRIELGAIQGARASLDPIVTKVATRDFHSVRPKHLLMAIFYSFAAHCKIDAILCVTNLFFLCVLRHNYRSRHLRVKMSYIINRNTWRRKRHKVKGSSTDPYGVVERYRDPCE